jgi:hypothetical protein
MDVANERTFYIVFDFFLNVSQLYLTFLILFQKLYKAVLNGNVDLVQDCLHKGADLHYEDDFVSSIYTKSGSWVYVRLCQLQPEAPMCL